MNVFCIVIKIKIYKNTFCIKMASESTACTDNKETIITFIKTDFDEIKKFMQEGDLEHITDVTIEDCKIDINKLLIILDNLLRCNTLTKLNLQGNKFGDEGAKEILEFFKAREHKRTDAYLKGKPKVVDLLELNLLDNGITMEGAKILCQEAPESLLRSNKMSIFNIANDKLNYEYTKIRYERWMWKFH